MTDTRSTREHLTNRCMLNRKPYKRHNGDLVFRVRCGSRCKRSPEGNIACVLSNQPPPDYVIATAAELRKKHGKDYRP